MDLAKMNITIPSEEFRKTGHQLELEEMFRTFYAQADDPAYHLPHPYAYYEQEILKAVNRYPDSLTLHKCASLLNEEAFFDKDTDTLVHPHISYFPPIWHVDHFIVIQIVLEGSLTTYIADQELKLGKGNVCIIAPGTRHAVSCFSEANAMKILIRTSSFEKVFFGILKDSDTVLAEFFFRTLYSSNPHPFLFFAGDWDPEMMEILARTIREGRSHRSFRSQMQNSLMNQFFIMLLRNHEKDLVFPEHTSDIQNANLIFLLKYIQEHAASITLPELSQLFNYSERHIQRVLRSSTGKSFTEITQSIRMREASRMLRSTDVPVFRIASDLGYANMGNFRKIFRKTYGMSPIDYRRDNTQARQ
jgi:AraC-like DNA-binding protein